MCRQCNITDYTYNHDHYCYYTYDYNYYYTVDFCALVCISQ